MKTLKGTLTAIAIAGLCVGASLSAKASFVPYDGTKPLYFNPGGTTTVGIVGIIEDDPDAPKSTPGLNASVASELEAAQKLLDLSGGVNEFKMTLNSGAMALLSTAPTDYQGQLSDAFKPDTVNVHVSNYEYVLAKYDGPNAGSVLFYLGDNSSVDLPLNAYTIWGSETQYQLSHWTGFNYAVPEPATAIAGMLLLLPFGVSAVRIMRRKI